MNGCTLHQYSKDYNDEYKKRNDMKDKITKILYSNNVDMEYADDLIEELCVLFNVSNNEVATCELRNKQLKK